MRFSSFRAFVAIAAASLLLVGCGGGTSMRPPIPDRSTLTSATSSNSWTEIPSPNSGNAAWGNVLYAVNDLASNDAWAVGALPVRSAYLTATLAEHWNGSRWSIVPTPAIAKPTARLSSLTSIAANAVWAAGYGDDPSCLCGETVVDRWNGVSWIRQTTPTPGVAAYLNSISATSSSNIWAAGYEWPTQSYDIPLLLHNNGTRWSADSLSQFPYGQLYSVYATAQDDAWAFGFYDNDVLLALHWNGTGWRQTPFPSSAGDIVSMSGTSSNDVWAAGGFYGGEGAGPDALLYHWNGASWKPVYIQGLLAPSWISGISARASNDVWLVGYARVYPQWSNYISHVTYHWDGTQWKDVVNPDQIGCCELLAVSARTSSDAWTVGMGGYDYTIKGTFTMHYGP
jgi:hypothetical protein